MRVPILLTLILALPALLFAGRFETNGEIITDTQTGLQWRVGPDRDIDWYDACAWVDDLGGSWRMPRIDELRELCEAGIGQSPTFDDWGPFEQSGFAVWSGEICRSHTGASSQHAWYYGFGGVGKRWDGCDGSRFYRVWAVRD